MNQQSWLEKLESRHPRTIKLGLERVSAVAENLQLLKLKPTVITIAGTNGKGSTLKALECLLIELGYQVGSYTSPHLLRFNERIRVQQEDISEEDLCTAFETVEQSAKDTELTYFEFTTLAALEHFKNQQLDFILLEVGLGGRLDAVNCVEPDLSIITSIDYDHMSYLGSTRALIANEKAGILRKTKAWICGDPKPPLSLIHHAQQLNATGHYYHRDFSAHRLDQQWYYQGINHSFAKLKIPQILLNNAANALAALEVLDLATDLSQQLLNSALSKINLTGRQQSFDENGVTCIYDVAHNHHATSELAQLIQAKKHSGQCFAVFGALETKDIAAMIKPLLDVIDVWYPFTLNVEQGVESKSLAQQISLETNNKVSPEDNFGAAWEKAWARAKQGDIICAFGSFYTVADALRHRER